MPIYEYECGSCEYRFEVKQGFNDAALTACGRCGGAVTKLISAPAIMFKGEGWYVTDYSDKLNPSSQSGSGEKPVEGQKEQKDKLITEDDVEKGKKQIDDITKKYADSVDDLIKSKSDEIMLD